MIDCGEQYEGSLRNKKTELPYYPTILFLGIYLDKNIIKKEECTPIFIATLFTTTKTWKQLKCLSTDNWFKSDVYIHSRRLLRHKKE